jgi:pimeloyl-ACP methyl ester carboxylesterase
MAALAVRLKGAILMGHSESGFFPQQAALIDPAGIRGIVSIEMPCQTTLTAAQLSVLAKIPTLVMFGDHLGDVQGGPANWANSFETCQTFVKQLKSAGGDAEMMHLPALGIRGNSHMLMQDRNSDQLAGLVLRWIDTHVEAKAR